jgi:hypothetical protein
MALDSHYDVLGVARSADSEITRAGYRVLAKRYHPDTSTDPKDVAAARFRTSHEAYEVLSDARQRAKYDAQLNADALAADQRASQAPPFQWPPQERSWTSQSQTTALEGTHSARGRICYVVWLISTILVIIDILAIKTWPELSVPLIILLFAIIILATRLTIEPNLAAAVIARRVYSAFVLAYVGFVGLLLAVLGIVAMAVGVGLIR